MEGICAVVGNVFQFSQFRVSHQANGRGRPGEQSHFPLTFGYKGEAPYAMKEGIGKEAGMKFVRHFYYLLIMPSALSNPPEREGTSFWRENTSSCVQTVASLNKSAELNKRERVKHLYEWVYSAWLDGQ